MEREEELNFDYLGYDDNEEIKRIIQNEPLLLSDKIMKINRVESCQERIILITTKAIYNLKKKSKIEIIIIGLKRRIPIEIIKGITISTITDEFVIHGLQAEYDYDYVSQKRKEIIDIINTYYQNITGNQLLFCQSNEKSLKNFVTLKKEKRNNPDYSRMNMNDQNNIEQFLNTIDRTSQLYSNKVGRTNTVFSKHKNIKTVKLEDFRILKMLGKGSFGKVSLVEYIPTLETFAMKSLNKGILLRQEQIENTLMEKEILQTIDHPFLCNLIFCFQTDKRIYFVMPFLIGGELFQHLRNAKVFNEEKVRFYGAQIAIGLQYLHEKKIIYRDLKPENILMDEDGYLKLADFGMAKRLEEDEKAMTFCGTPEYLAPEIINNEGSDESADWWSFGILMYEMLIGIPPFYMDNTHEMYRMIAKDPIKIPSKSKLSPDAKDIIFKLLDKNKTTRLGTKKGLDEIKSHPFFLALDFNLIYKKKLQAPFIPIVNNVRDYGNFDSEFTNESITPSIITNGQMKAIQKNQEKFTNFDK